MPANAPNSGARDETRNPDYITQHEEELDELTNEWDACEGAAA